MFTELVARIPWPKPSGTSAERSDAITSESTFDIFRRLRQGPVLVERVSGIVEACDRMKQIAEEQPGVRYFVAETDTQAVVAEIDATVRVKRTWRRVAVR
jgi:hypothetical protein